MKRKQFYIAWIVFFVGGFGYAQDYERVDATIELYPTSFKSAEEFSKFITRDFTSEEEKVRAIYTWLIKNVAYEPEEYKKFNFNFKNYRERNLKEEKTRQKVIQRTLEKGIAVCEGYAMLFERMCELQGISSYLVRGDIKTNFNDIGRPFKRVHMWNVVIIDAHPYLIDATWGAGKYRDKFVKEPSYFYYKTPPKLFANTHYPHLEEDAFLNYRFSREQFAAMPILICQGLTLDDVESPKNGIISSDDDDGLIRFSIKNTTPTAVAYSYGKEKVVVPITVEEEALQFEVPIELGKGHLLIYFDDQPALGYKVK
jgi:hypothetical protein